MTLRKADLSNASWRITTGLWSMDADKALTPAAFKSLLTKAKATGPRAKVLKLAYDAAKTKAGGNPTRAQVSEQVSKALSSLGNERAKGRINDGFVDTREAGLVKGDLAAAVYKLVDSGVLGANSAPTKASELRQSATFARLDQAVSRLSPVIDAGFANYDPDNDPDGEGPANVLRAAANAAGLSSSGRAAILTALNGATTRNDSGEYPTAGDVKQLLENARSKLKAADGAQIVNFAKPDRAATAKKDRVVTGLEVDRTPAVTGMTSRALLQFAASL